MMFPRKCAAAILAETGDLRRFDSFVELHDVQELSNFFERRVSACQVGVSGDVSFDDDF
jgi:hypothetical protein